MRQVDGDAIAAFMRLATRLKAVRRQGWLDRGVNDPESSADHSWNLAIFAWLSALTRDDLDTDRVLLLALVHDLPEALAGDTTPFDRYRQADGAIPEAHFTNAPDYDQREKTAKQEREREALDQMLATLPPDLAGAIADAWAEYTERTTPEALYVRQMDKLETLLQAELYRSEQPEIVIDSFRRGTRRDVSDPSLQPLLAAISGSADEDLTDGEDDEDCRDDG